MDELDVKLLRALISESAVAPTDTQVRSSLRRIARRLGADDMTVSNRFKRLQESGCMTRWQLVINPSYFGYGMLDLLLDVQPETAKIDMIKKLKLVQSVIVIVNFYGRSLKVIFLYNSGASRSRTVELISRITNAEKVTSSRLALPRSETERLTPTDIVIVAALANDARKSPVLVAKELGLSTKTVRNRIDRLRREKTIFALPDLSVGDIPGFIPATLTYSYTNHEMKGGVDRAVLSHFDSNYLWGGFGDPDHGFVVLSAPTIADVQRFLEWARKQQGIASAQVDIPTELMSFPEKFAELLSTRKTEQLAPRHGE